MLLLIIAMVEVLILGFLYGLYRRAQRFPRLGRAFALLTVLGLGMVFVAFEAQQAALEEARLLYLLSQASLEEQLGTEGAKVLLYGEIETVLQQALLAGDHPDLQFILPDGRIALGQDYQLEQTDLPEVVDSERANQDAVLMVQAKVKADEIHFTAGKLLLSGRLADGQVLSADAALAAFRDRQGGQALSYFAALLLGAVTALGGAYLTYQSLLSPQE